MPGWRVGFCVGNADLVGNLATIKGYLDYGIFAPAQLGAATALATCDADVAENRRRYQRRAELLVASLASAGWTVPMPKASMFVWAPLPASHRSMGAVAFASALLQEARVAVSRGWDLAMAERVRTFFLVESDDRARRACAAIGEFLRKHA